MAPIRVGGTRDAASFVPVNSLVDPATGSVQPDGQSGWTLAMSEEFAGSVTVLDAPLGLVKFRAGGPTWGTWYPEWPSFMAQDPGENHTNTNDDTYYDTSQVSIASNQLRLDTDRVSTVAGLNYTAGMIQSRPGFVFTHGYIEARIKMDAMPTGIWPAGWTLCDNFGEGTFRDEIDYFEVYGNSPYDTYNNVFLAGGLSYIDVVDIEPVTDWHTYGLKWDASSVTFYQDGVQTGVTTTRVPTQDAVLIFNVAAYEPLSPAHSSGAMSIDHIRVWQ